MKKRSVWRRKWRTSSLTSHDTRATFAASEGKTGWPCWCLCCCWPWECWSILCIVCCWLNPPSPAQYLPLFSQLASQFLLILPCLLIIQFFNLLFSNFSFSCCYCCWTVCVPPPSCLPICLFLLFQFYKFCFFPAIVSVRTYSVHLLPYHCYLLLQIIFYDYLQSHNCTVTVMVAWFGFRC